MFFLTIFIEKGDLPYAYYRVDLYMTNFLAFHMRELKPSKTYYRTCPFQCRGGK